MRIPGNPVAVCPVQHPDSIYIHCEPREAHGKDCRGGDEPEDLPDPECREKSCEDEMAEYGQQMHTRVKWGVCSRQM